MKNILEQAIQLYPKGSLFLSASKALKSPIRVTSLKLSEVYKDTVVNSEGGIIFSDNVWAIKL